MCFNIYYDWKRLPKSKWYRQLMYQAQLATEQFHKDMLEAALHHLTEFTMVKAKKRLYKGQLIMRDDVEVI